MFSTVMCGTDNARVSCGLAHNGIFGRGTYFAGFAEHAAKIDQYVHVDKEWMGGNREQSYGAKCRLHNKLYLSCTRRRTCTLAMCTTHWFAV